MRNHENQELDHAEDADSFVERRLRERLWAAETALERTRERLTNAQKHHGELRAEVCHTASRAFRLRCRMQRSTVAFAISLLFLYRRTYKSALLEWAKCLPMLA
jgi:hypothetical protein